MLTLNFVYAVAFVISGAFFNQNFKTCKLWLELAYGNSVAGHLWICSHCHWWRLRFLEWIC
jgi:hypothetical protein